MRWCWRGEEGFGAHDVDAAVGVDELGDVDVAGYGDERVGVLAGDVRMIGILFGEEGDHVANGHLGGGFEVEVEAHGDVLSRGFGAGPEETVGIVEVAFVDDELEGSGELGFESGDVDFSVALSGVAVADFEVRAFGVDGEIDGGAGDELLVVHVAAVHPGRSGVVFSALGGGDTHAAEEGMEGDVDAGREVSDHFGAVEGDEAGFAVGEVVGEEAAAGAEGVAGPWDVDVDFLNANFEDIAGCGSVDGDGAGEDVASGALVGGGIVFVDVVDVGGDVGWGDAEGFEALAGAAGGEGLDFDGIAGFDGEGWLGLRGVEAPGDGGGRGEEGLRSSLGVRGGDSEESSGTEGGSAGRVEGHEVLYITKKGRPNGNHGCMVSIRPLLTLAAVAGWLADETTAECACRSEKTGAEEQDGAGLGNRRSDVERRANFAEAELGLNDVEIGVEDLHGVVAGGQVQNGGVGGAVAVDASESLDEGTVEIDEGFVVRTDVELNRAGGGEIEAAVKDSGQFLGGVVGLSGHEHLCGAGAEGDGAGSGDAGDAILTGGPIEDFIGAVEIGRAGSGDGATVTVEACADEYGTAIGAKG
jgi:hypothetical protein